MLKSPGVSRRDFDFDSLSSLSGTGTDAVVWARQGTLLVERGDLSGALQCFQRSLERNLDCFDAWTGLARVFVRMHDARRAEACLDVARRIQLREVREATA